MFQEDFKPAEIKPAQYSKSVWSVVVVVKVALRLNQESCLKAAFEPQKVDVVLCAVFL